MATRKKVTPAVEKPIDVVTREEFNGLVARVDKCIKEMKKRKLWSF